MFDAFLKFLGGEPGEEKQMWLLLGKGFFMGIFIATYQIGAETLFLQVMGESYLDIAFFTAGGLGIISAGLFVTLQKRINFSTLVVSNVFLTFVFIGGLRYSFEVLGYEAGAKGEFSLLPFVLFIMIGPITALTLLGFWGVFGRIFDARQAKRIIGGIDTGQLTATIIAFFSIPLITRLDFINETYDLLFVSAFAAFGILFFTIWIVRNYNLDNITKVKEGEKVEKVGFFALVKDNYLRLLSLFLIFSMGAAVFVQYTFYSATETMFSNEQELSDFLSFFSGTVMIMSFLIQSFVNDIIIGRFGLKVALMTMPAILVLFTIGAIVSGHIYEYDVKTEEFLLFFMFTVSAQAFTASLRDALESPAFKLFFLPIDVKIRFDIQTRIEGVVNQFAMLAAGAAQLGLGLLAFFQLIHFSYFIIALSGMIVWLASKLFNQYKITLKKTLEKQKQDLRGDIRHEHNAVNVLRDELKRKGEDRIYNALRLLEKIDPIEFEFALLDQLNSRHAKIRQFAYAKLTDHLCYGALGIIKSEAKTEGDETAEILAKKAVDELQAAADFEITDVSIRKLVRSTDYKERIKGAHLLAKLTEDKHIVYVLELLRDINVQVRAAAMATAGKLRRPEVWPVLIENLHLATYGNYSSSALTHAGEVAFHNIDTSFYKTGQYKSTMMRIIQILGRVGGRQATELLWKKIDFPDKKIVSEILRALSHVGFEGRDFQAARIKIILESAIGDMAWNIKTLQDVPVETELDELIREAIIEENAINHDNIFMLLSMIYDPQNILLIKENIDAGTVESVTFGIEMLDLFCEEELKPKLFPVLDNLKDEEKLAKLQNNYPPEFFDSYNDLLLQVVNRDYNRISRYTKALAMLRVSQMSESEVGYDLVANLFNPDKLMLQTAAYVIYKLDQDAYHANTRRLKPSIKKELDKAILPPVYLEDGEEYHQNLLLIERVVLLKSLPHFAGVHGEVITLIADVMEEITVRAGTELIQVGDHGGTPLYIVRNGKVAIKKDGEEDVVLEEKGIFGEQLVSESEVFDISAVAETDCALLVLRKEELLDIMVQHLDLTESYLKVLNDEIEKEEEEFEEEMMMDII